MNEITNLTLSTPMPRIATLKVVEHLVIEVVWESGFRRSRTDVVDLSPIINLLKLYRPLRNDEVLFRTVHLIEEGRVLAWGEDEQIDMPAESVEELAQETMTPNDLRDFLKTNNLTHNEAAALLDRSRRQIENYLSGKERIPRLFALACLGLTARRQQLARGPTRLSHANVHVVGSETSESTRVVQVKFRSLPNGMSTPASEVALSEIVSP